MEKTGIGLLFKDGTQRDSAEIADTESFDSSAVEAVTFEVGGHSWLIAPEASQCYFCGGNVVCKQAEVVAAANPALLCFNGKENTEAYRTGMSYTNKDWAVFKAYNTVLDGQNCWLPSLGELFQIFKHRDTITALLQKCGLDGLTKSNYWSSTLGNRKDTATGEISASVSTEGYLYTVFGVYANGNYDGFNVQGYYWALPITEYKKE